MEFDQYREEFATKRAEAESALASTAFPVSEALALKVAFLIDTGAVSLPDDSRGTALASVIGKFTNEVLAFAGAVRMGALQGAWHHVRAMIELRAAVHYLFADATKAPHRVAQYVEFGEMAPWAARRRLELLLEDKKISQADFDRRNTVSDALIEHATAARIAEWCALFGAGNDRELAHRHRWHDGSIAKIVKALDVSEIDYLMYEVACHSAHVSPLGHRTSGRGRPRLFGYDPNALRNAIGLMVAQTILVLQLIDTQLADGGLLTRMVDELVAMGVLTEEDRAEMGI